MDTEWAERIRVKNQGMHRERQQRRRSLFDCNPCEQPCGFTLTYVKPSPLIQCCEIGLGVAPEHTYLYYKNGTCVV